MPVKSTLAWSTSHFCVLNIPSGMWISTYLKERDCSLRLTLGEQNRSERNALKPAGHAGGRRSRKQCSDTKIRGAKLRGATRSAGGWRMNTAEISAA